KWDDGKYWEVSTFIDLIKMPRRFEIALLCAVGTLLCYADRTNIGVAIPAFEMDHALQGQVLAAFFYGYICTQYFGAWLASKLGPKNVLLGGVAVWSLFDLLTVFCVNSPVLLWCTRAAMGLGEGILFPCMHNIASGWFPVHERSRLNSFISSGMDLGTILSMFVAPFWMQYYGYQAIFYFFGCLSTLWLVVFFWRGSSRPETDRYINSHEADYIIETRNTAASKEFLTPHSSRSTTPPILPWKAYFSSKALWAIYCSHFTYNYGWYVLLGWTPQYLRLVLHLELEASGVAAAVPYICGYLGILFWGWLSDYLLACDIRLVAVRKFTNNVSFFGSAVCLYLLRYASSTFQAITMLCITLFLSRAAVSGYWINMIDIAPRHAGHVMGISNTMATLPGIIGNILTGEILYRSGDWNLVFEITSIILILGGLVFQLWAQDHDVFANTQQFSNEDILDENSPLLSKQ
ncbi:sialin, partial [Thraustotheca clavata]